MLKIILATALALSFSAFASDVEKSNEVDVDHSKNPITGTKKTTVTKVAKAKNADGSESKTKTKDTTKMHKDGKVEKSHEVESDSETK